MDANLDIGKVISTTFGVISKEFTNVALLAVMFVGAPSLVLSLLAASAADPYSGFSITGVVVQIILTLLPILLQAAVTQVAVEHLMGRQTSLSDAANHAFSQFLPLLGLSILLSIAYTLGFLLLIIPGLIMVTFWIVAVPALVVERETGVFEAFSRSAALTEGQRWRIFGLILIGFVVIFVAGFIIGAMFSSGYAVSGRPISTAAIVMSSLLGTVSGALSSVAVAVLYVELRNINDSTSLNQIGEVFS